jgi:hypothetical protein
MEKWRNLQYEELRNLYSSPNMFNALKLRRMGLEGYVTHMGETGNAYKILVGKPEGKRQLWRPRHK